MKNEKYKHNHSALSVPKLFKYINMADGKTQHFSLYLTSITTETCKYPKSFENVEITIYCTGLLTINTFELSVISPFLLSHPTKFDLKMHAMGTIFVIDLIFLKL